MNFKFTKSLLLSSILFTGATSWNAYSKNYYIVQENKKDIKVNYSDIGVKIKNLANNIKLNHKKCNELLEEVKADQFLEILKSIKKKIEDVISDKKHIDDDQLEELDNQQYGALSEFILKSFDSIKQKNKKAASGLNQEFLKNIYLIKLTALAIISKDLNENLVSNDELKIPENKNFNAKKLLKYLKNYLRKYSSDDLWKQMDNEEFKKMTDQLFEQITTEKLKQISKQDLYKYNEADEKKLFEIELNTITKKLYEDLKKVLQYCSNNRSISVDTPLRVETVTLGESNRSKSVDTPLEGETATLREILAEISSLPSKISKSKNIQEKRKLEKRLSHLKNICKLAIAEEEHVSPEDIEDIKVEECPGCNSVIYRVPSNEILVPNKETNEINVLGGEEDCQLIYDVCYAFFPSDFQDVPKTQRSSKIRSIYSTLGKMLGEEDDTPPRGEIVEEMALEEITTKILSLSFEISKSENIQEKAKLEQKLSYLKNICKSIIAKEQHVSPEDVVKVEECPGCNSILCLVLNKKSKESTSVFVLGKGDDLQLTYDVMDVFFPSDPQNPSKIKSIVSALKKILE